SYKDLPAEKFDFVPLDLEVIFQFWEIQYACKVKWKVNIQVDPEQWFLGERIQFTIEVKIILIVKIGRYLCPDRIRIIDDIVNFNCLVFWFSVFIFSVWYRFFLCSKLYRHRKELCILV